MAGGSRGDGQCPQEGQAAALFPIALLPMTSRAVRNCSQLLYLSCCFAAMEDRFSVLRCHILPCASFNFLIENCITDALFL